MSAAPMALPPAVNWTGFYLGLQGGIAFGNTGTLSLTPFTPALQTAFAPGFSGNFDGGFVGGIHAGYDWQFGNVVFGGVIDVNYARIGDRQIGRSTTPATYTIARDLDYLASARARVGYLVTDRVLAYATGGLAYGKVDFSYSQPGSGATFTTSGGQNRNVGYTVGAGVETLLTSNISLGLEYLYTDLGGNNFAARLNGGPFTPGTDLTGSDRRFDFHTVQARLSYRF
jgi:outer membrane immunogenic protein